MSTTPDTKQDHPGPEWVSVNDMWWHPGLDYHAETVEEARAISAAALDWERLRECATKGCERGEQSGCCWRCDQ